MKKTNNQRDLDVNFPLFWPRKEIVKWQSFRTRSMQKLSNFVHEKTLVYWSFLMSFQMKLQNEVN